jgi:MFS superfamily sulfate permease-like transporter
MESITVQQAIKQHPWVFASFVISTLGLWAGAITAIASLIFFNVDGIVTGVVISAVSFLVKVPQIFFTRRRNREAFAEQSRKLETERKQELDRIRRSMTPSEWELYKLQLENQRLLTELKNRPAGNSNSGGNAGPRAVYGFTQEVGD